MNPTDYTPNASSNPGKTTLRRRTSLKATRRRSSLTREYSSVSFNSDTSDINLASDYNNTPLIISDRESHTTDVESFQYHLDLLRGDERSEDDTPFHEPFWNFIQKIIEEASTPLGFGINDANTTVPKGPHDISKFIERIGLISPINPIHPVLLSQQTKIPLDIILNELLYATKVRLVDMIWAPQCRRCGSVCCGVKDLCMLEPKVYCAGCSAENEITTTDKIMVLFKMNPEVLYILAENFACVPSKKSMAANSLFVPCPATNTGSGFRFSVGCGGDKYSLRPSLPPGRYRMHCPVAKTDNYLEIRRQAAEKDKPLILEVPVSSIVHDHPSASKRVLTVAHGKIHFDVLPDTHSFFVLWLQDDLDDDTLLFLPEEERPPFTSASQIMNHPAYQRIYSKQVLGKISSLSISFVSLVFTDVVGSTDLYARLGDGEAFELIKKHFKILFRSFSQRGRVVKTIGDAVMASFPSGRAAIVAVADAIHNVLRRCVGSDGIPLQIRVGVHSGPALIVPLNGINDFFGQNVNVAARVEASAGASECMVTDAVISDPDAASAYEEVVALDYFDPTDSVCLSLKGVKGVVNARGFIASKRVFQESYGNVVG